MKNRVKKSLAIILSLVIMAVIVPVGALTASATSKTVDEAIAWVKSKVGTYIDYDGAYGAQCTDLIYAYYNYLGEAPRYDDANGYQSNSLPAGWTRVSAGTPQKGDILVYSNHVAIFESTYSTYHQNYLGSAVINLPYAYNDTSYMGVTYWGYIRPNFYTHSHSYSSSVTKQPTCTATGVRTYTCSCGASYTEVIDKLGHNYVPTVTKPTCTESGYTTYICSRCTDTYTADVTPPVAHHYVLTDVGTNSDGTAVLDYRCSGCKQPFQKNVELTDGKTEFMEEKIEGISDELTEKKTQYRAKQKESKTSKTSKKLDGWEYERTEYSAYGAWSDWTTSYMASDDLTNVDCKTIYLWYAYICPNCGKHDPAKGGCSSCGYYLDDWHCWTIWLDTPFSNGTPIYWENKTKIYTEYGELFSANDHNPELGYRKQTRTATHYFYKWSEFSDWQDEPITADEKTQVETRTLYRYKLDEMLHDYSIPVRKEASCEADGFIGVKCSDCGKIKIESVIKKTAHTYDSDYDSICNACHTVRNISLPDCNEEANALKDFAYTVNGDNICITGYKGNNENIIIASSYFVGGKEYTVNAIGEYAFESNTAIKKLVLPETVEEVGSYAFYGCTALKTAIIYNNAEIGNLAFGYYYISQREDGLIEDFSIVGFHNSSAHIYANKNQIKFQSINLVGDSSPDGKIDANDLTALRQALLTDPEYGEVLDANGDGAADVRDLIRLKKFLADNTTPLGKQAIPAPAS